MQLRARPGPVLRTNLHARAPRQVRQVPQILWGSARSIQGCCPWGLCGRVVASIACGLESAKRSKSRLCSVQAVAVSNAASRQEELETRLAQFREELIGRDIQAYIVPTDDAHMSEVPPDCFARRKFLTGFSGSAGTALVTRHEAKLWTDGRYFIQAKMELSSSWQLMKSGIQGTPDIDDWLIQNLQKGDVVGIDPTVHAALPAVELQSKLQKAGINLRSLQPNLVDQIWKADRSRPTSQVRLHPQHYSGSDTGEKLARVREKMVENEADVFLVTALDEVGCLRVRIATVLTCETLSIAAPCITCPVASVKILLRLHCGVQVSLQHPWQ